jgi:hypothetical protein
MVAWLDRQWWKLPDHFVRILSSTLPISNSNGRSVMGIFPIVMNIVQFWIIDTIVKATDVLSSPSPSPQEEIEEPFLNSQQDDEDCVESEDLEAATKPQRNSTDSKLMQSKAASASGSVS